LGKGRGWVHLGERDCSACTPQTEGLRRSPGPVDPGAEERARIGKDLCRCDGQTFNTTSAAGNGRILYGKRRVSYFIEMNRGSLQVEHPPVHRKPSLGVDPGARTKFRVAAEWILSFTPRRPERSTGHAIGRSPESTLEKISPNLLGPARARSRQYMLPQAGAWLCGWNSALYDGYKIPPSLHDTP